MQTDEQKVHDAVEALNKSLALGQPTRLRQIEKRSDLAKYLIGGMGALAFVLANFTSSTMSIEGRFGFYEAVAVFVALTLCVAAVAGSFHSLWQHKRFEISYEILSLPLESGDDLQRVRQQLGSLAERLERMNRFMDEVERRDTIRIAISLCGVAAAACVVAFGVVLF